MLNNPHENLYYLLTLSILWLLYPLRFRIYCEDQLTSLSYGYLLTELSLIPSILFEETSEYIREFGDKKITDAHLPQNRTLDNIRRNLRLIKRLSRHFLLLSGIP